MAATGKMAAMAAVLAALVVLAAPVARAEVAPLEYDGPVQPEGYRIPIEWHGDSGYLTYCPCEGHFGHQVEAFLGTLALAKAINRTLILPPFIFNFTGFSSLPFGTFFDLDVLKEYHRIIPMDVFADELAPAHWPPGSRVGHCISLDPTTKCQHMYNPPGQELWYLFKIRFFSVKALTVPTLVEPGEEAYMRRRWTQAAQPSKAPVVALEYAPGSVPAAVAHRALQAYLPFAPTWEADTALYLAEHLPQRPYLAVHLRLSADWPAHCAALEAQAAPAGGGQYHCQSAPGPLAPGLCNPSVTALQQLVRRAVRRTRARAVYIATDLPVAAHASADAFALVAAAAEEAMAEVVEDGGEVVWLGTFPDDPITASTVGVMRDIGVLAHADVAILNCASGLSSLVAREREARRRGPTLFWGQPLPTGLPLRTEL